MKQLKRMTLVACTMAVPAFAFAQAAPQQPAIETKQPMMDGAIRTTMIQIPQWPAGFVPRRVEEQTNILAPLAKVTEAALTQNGLDDFVERLSEPDRKRIRKENFAKKDFPELNRRLASIRSKFRQKYDSDFSISNPARVFDAPVQVAQGEVSDPRLAADRFPVTAVIRKEEPEAQMASGRIDRINPKFTDDPKQGQYLHTGRKVAIVCLPSDDLTVPGINASLVHEFLDQWKIDVPDSVTGQRLHDNLLREFTRLDDDSANWPGNVNDAKRLFVHHVLAAAYDLPTAPAMRTTEQPKVDRLDGATPDQEPENNRNLP